MMSRIWKKSGSLNLTFMKDFYIESLEVDCAVNEVKNLFAC